MLRTVIIAGLVIVLIANTGGVALAELNMPLHAGSTWLVALGSLLLSSVLLAIAACQAERYLAAIGFLVLGLYAVVHSVAVGVWANDMKEIYLAIYPARMMVMAIGLFLLGSSDWFARWVRGVGILTGAMGVILGGMVMYGADLSGDAGIPDLLNMATLVLFLLTVLGWLNEIRTNVGIGVISCRTTFAE